jgi:two-component system, OmpR family, response regulator
LLDIGLPDRSGIDVLNDLRAQQSSPRVVILSAFASDEDRAHGLNMGADAYVAKGASLEVIEATCRAVMRKHPPVALWSLDDAASSLRAPIGTLVELTYQELSFLRVVLRVPGKVVSRQELLSALDKTDTLSNQRNLDNIIARLRRKVAQNVGLELPVRSAYGSGYIYG